MVVSVGVARLLDREVLFVLLVWPSVSKRAVLSPLPLDQRVEEIKKLHEQARLIIAGQLLEAVDQYLATGEHHGRKEVKAAVTLLEGELKAPFIELRHRAAECRGALDDWHSVRDSNLSLRNSTLQALIRRRGCRGYIYTDTSRSRKWL